MSADTWAVRTPGLTGWGLGVALPASASHVCSLAQPLNNPLQRQPQSHFRDEETEARRGPETWPRSHSRLGAEPRPRAPTFPEILSNRETESGLRWGQGGARMAGGQGSRSGGGSRESPGVGVRRSCSLPGPASGFRCAVGPTVSAHSPPIPTPPHRPKYKGKYCVGERKRFRLCSLQACPAGRPSFRQVQCSRFDAMLYKGQLHTWVPVVNDGESSCPRGH